MSAGLIVEAGIVLAAAAASTVAVERARDRDLAPWDTERWRAGLTRSGDYEGRHRA